jgi:hypothetical protein
MGLGDAAMPPFNGALGLVRMGLAGLEQPVTEGL